MPSYNMWSCVAAFFSLTIIFFETYPYCSMYQYFIPFFLLLNNVIFYLPVHHLMDIWFVYTLWSLWIMLLRTIIYKFLYEYIFYLFGYILEFGGMGHLITLCLTFWGLPKEATLLYNPTSNVPMFQFFCTLVKYLLFSVFYQN